MRSGIVFGSLVLAMLAPLPSMGHAQQAESQKSVRAQVIEEIGRIEKELVKVQPGTNKFDLLQTAEKRIQALRAKEKRQTTQDEIYLDSLEGALKEIPRGNKFRKSECKDYKTNIQSLYDPSPNERPDPAEDPGPSEEPDPAAASALRILNGLCES